MTEEYTCLDCDSSVRCHLKGHEHIGWCEKYHEWVTDEETVEELGNDCFEEAR